MHEMIVRISNDTDVEILFNDLIKKEIFEKKLSYKDFMMLMEDASNESKKTFRPVLNFLEKDIISFAETTARKWYVVKQEERRRFITYDFGSTNKGALEINFPAGIYVLEVLGAKIVEIEAYTYLKWEEEKTVLYKYAMPNMLSANRICIGAAPKEIKESVVQALENIIYAPYSHSTTSNVKGFKNSIDYFKFLESDKIEKKYLHKHCTLKNVMNGER